MKKEEDNDDNDENEEDENKDKSDLPNISLKCDLTLASIVKKETHTNSCKEDAKSFAEKQIKLVIDMFRQGFPILDSDSYFIKNLRAQFSANRTCKGKLAERQAGIPCTFS
ncbi:hypothetical protein BTVI_121363 [Pitangus sulphuratus]|nr:hypothetical protein BTVI_121363 [Pitangus sulphuratus]